MPSLAQIAVDVKTKQKTFPRPPWTSEYVTLAETLRPWSSASTGDLPPPKVPQNQEPVPLDLYTSISTYEAAQQSSFGEGCNRSSFSKLKTKRRSKKVKTTKAKLQLQGKNMTSDMYEMAFPPTHSYHALHPHAPTPISQKAQLAKARWKSKGKSLQRFNPQKIYQLQLPQKCASQRTVDMMAYRRNVRSSCTPRSESQCREPREARMQKRCKSSSQYGFTNILQQDDCYAIAALKAHERDFCNGSKVKRLKPTSAPAAVDISSMQSDSKPKYSLVTEVKRRHIPVESKDLSLQDIAKVMKSRFSPDSRREKTQMTRKSVSPEIINAQKCSTHSSLSPRKHSRDEVILQNLKKGTRNESLSPRKSLRDGAKAQELQEERHLPTSRKGRCPQVRDGGAMQILCPTRKDTRNIEADIDKDVTRAIRRQRMHMLSTLAEQLVKRVDAACAEQQLLNTLQAMSEPTSEPHMDLDNEPCDQQVGLNCTEEPIQVELKFYNHSTQPDILYHGNLSEQEQAGCEVVKLPTAENMLEVVTSNNDPTRHPIPVTIETRELNNIPVSETSPHGSNMIVEGMSTDNIPSGCSSYGPSSPSTDSSSPVILPTGAKYHIGRIKCNTNVEEQARKRQKEAWTLPAEEDIHSVINVYTQHWLSREKKKNRAKCDFSQVGPGEFEENACPRTRSRTPIHEHAPEKHKFKFGSVPMCSELEVSEPYIKSLESDCFTSTKSADSSGVHTELPENDINEPVAFITQESNVDYFNVGETPSPLENSMATIAVEPMQEENHQKKELTGDTGQRKPEVMLVQIGDLKLCQSPTSFHLRLGNQTGALDSDALDSPKMGRKAADASTVWSDDYQRQVFRSQIIPMKITYARRYRTKTMPDGACMDDERIVVEVQQMQLEGDELVMHDIPEIEKSDRSPSETSRENLRVNLDEVQNCESANYHHMVEKDGYKNKDESEAQNPSHLLDPEIIMPSTDLLAAFSQVNSTFGKDNYQEVAPESTCSKSQTMGDEKFASLSLLIAQAEEMLEDVPRDASSTVEEKMYSKLDDMNFSSKRNQCEGRLDNFCTDPYDFLEESIKDNVGTEEREYHWSKRENEEEKQSDSTSLKSSSTYSRYSTSSSKNKFNNYAKSTLKEQQSHLLSEAKCEIQPNLPQKLETTREWQLKSRRNQLEAELQTLNAEIRKTRGKLQTNQSVFDPKVRKYDPIASRVKAIEQPSTMLAGYSSNSRTGGVLSDDMVSSTLSHPHSGSQTLSNSPKQKSHAYSPELTASSLCRTLDRRFESSIYSGSFVSEDIEMDRDILTARRLDMVADIDGERYDSKYELLPKQPKFLNKSFKEYRVESKPNDEDDGYAKEISEEDLLNRQIMSTQDEFMDEGSENSTGRATQDKREEAIVPPASPQLKVCSSSFLEHQINTLASQKLQPILKKEEKVGVLSRVAMKFKPLSEAGKGFPDCVEDMKVGLLPIDLLDRDSLSCLDDTTWGVPSMREDRFHRASPSTDLYVTPIIDRGNINQTSSGENISGSRSNITNMCRVICAESSAHISEEAENSPLSSKNGKKQRSESSACVNTNLPLYPLLHDTSQASSMEEESSPSSRKDGESRSINSASDIGTILQYPLVSLQTARATPLELKEMMASCETSDGQIDAVKATLPNLDEKNSILISLQDENCSSFEDCSKWQLWGISSEVPQNLMEESDGKLKPLISERTSPRISKDDVISVHEAAESAPSLRQDSPTAVVTNTFHSDVHSKNSNLLVTRTRPERSRHQNQEQMTREVRGSLCNQQATTSSNPIAENMMTDEGSDIILGFYDGRNEENDSCCFSSASGPLRNHCHRIDCGNNVVTNESGASTELHQGTKSSLVFEKHVESFADQLSCLPLVKKTQERCAGILDGLQCHVQNSENRGYEHWERLMRLFQENKRNHTPGVPTLFPHKAFAVTVQVKSSEIGEVPRVFLETSLTDESSTTIVPEVINDFVKARGDMFHDSSHVKQISQKFKPLKPSFLMSIDKAGYKEFDKMATDVKESWEKPLPPVLLLKTSKSSRTLAGTDSGEGESGQDYSLTSKDQPEFHSLGSFGILSNEMDTPLVADRHIALITHASKDCTSQGFGPKCTGASIKMTKEEAMADMPYRSQASTPVQNVDLLRSLPRQPLNLFPSLYDKGERSTSDNFEGFDVSEELENLDSELDEMLGDVADIGLTSEVKDGQLLKPGSSLHDLEEPLRESICRPWTELRTENHDVFMNNGSAYGLTKSSIESEVIPKSMCLFGELKVEDSSTILPVSSTFSEGYDGCVSTTSTHPEIDDRDIINQDVAAYSGIEDKNLQDIKTSHTDVKCKTEADLASQILANVEHSQQDASAILISLSGTLMKNLGTVSMKSEGIGLKNLHTDLSTFTGSCEYGLEQTSSSSDCKHSKEVFRVRSNCRDLKHELGVKVDDYADEGLSDVNSMLGSARALTHTVTSDCFVSLRMTTKFENDDMHETVSNAERDHRGVINYLHYEDGAPEGIQVPRPYSRAPEKAEGSVCAELSAPSEEDEKLMREVLNSKLIDSSPSLLEEISQENGLNVPKKKVEDFDLDSQSSWSEDHGKLDNSQNISRGSADGRFAREDVFKTNLEQLKPHEGGQISTNPTTAMEFASQKSEQTPTWLPEEAHRLVECFLSSGSELLDRASQVSKAFSICSVVDSCPGDLPSLECSEHRKEVWEDQSSLFGDLPCKVLSEQFKKIEDDPTHPSLTCDSEGAKDAECVNPSRPDQIIALRFFDPCHYESGDSTLHTETALLDSRTTETLIGQEENNRFMTSSRPDAIIIQQSSKAALFHSKDSLSDIQAAPISFECIARGDVQDELGTKQSCSIQKRGPELLGFQELMNSVTSYVPQMVPALDISLQIPDVGDLGKGRESLHNIKSSIYDDRLNPCKEYSTVEVACEDHRADLQLDVVELNDNSIVYHGDSCISGRTEFTDLETAQEAEIQENKKSKLGRLPAEVTSTLTGHDQDSICSLAGSGGAQDLDGTLADIKLQTAAKRIGKHNMMADTLTDMLFETLLAEGLSVLACPSRSISRASSREENQTLTISKTRKPKSKSRSKRRFLAVLKHFLPTGWRAASVKHKADLFLQAEGLRSHPLSSAFGKSISISKIKELSGTSHNRHPSLDDFGHYSLVHPATVDITIPLLTSKDYIQAYVQKTLELSSFINDPSPSNWHDSMIPVGQEIYRRVMETQCSSRFGTLKHDDWQVYNRLLSDLVNESLVKYSAIVQQSSSNLALHFPVDGGNLVHFVTSRIVEHGSSILKNGPDIDKVVEKLLEDEQWEKCHEEAQDLVSDLAQGILCDLIDRFVEEMINLKVRTTPAVALE